MVVKDPKFLIKGNTVLWLQWYDVFPEINSVLDEVKSQGLEISNHAEVWAKLTEPLYNGEIVTLRGSWQVHVAKSPTSNRVIHFLPANALTWSSINRRMDLNITKAKIKELESRYEIRPILAAPGKSN